LSDGIYGYEVYGLDGSISCVKNDKQLGGIKFNNNTSEVDNTTCMYEGILVGKFTPNRIGQILLLLI